LPEKSEEILGKVLNASGERAIVGLFQAGGQELSGEELDVLNSLAARPGAVVELDWIQVSARRDKIMLVLPSILSVAAGAILGYHLALRFKQPVQYGMLLGAGIWLSLGLLSSFRYWKYTYGRGRQPNIVKIVRP
jgi:hypothetical protein